MVTLILTPDMVTLILIPNMVSLILTPDMMSSLGLWQSQAVVTMDIEENVELPVVMSVGSILGGDLTVMILSLLHAQDALGDVNPALSVRDENPALSVRDAASGKDR